MTKILLVEDDNSLREIYGVRLLAEGYTVVSAADGEKALALAISERPDLIISDVMMPRISGFEMLDLLRGNESTKNVKVIMLTALSSEHQRERGDALGADRYLVKSQVGIEDIIRTVHEVLNDQNGQRTVEQMENSTKAAHNAQVNAQKSQARNTVVINQPSNNNLPASGQSSFNPLAATSPDVVAGRPLPNLPSTPLQVPSYNQPPVQNNAAYYQGSPVMYNQEPVQSNKSLQDTFNVSGSMAANKNATPSAPLDRSMQQHVTTVPLPPVQSDSTNANATRVSTTQSLDNQTTAPSSQSTPAQALGSASISNLAQEPSRAQSQIPDPRINLSTLLGDINANDSNPTTAPRTGANLFPNH